MCQDHFHQDGYRIYVQKDVSPCYGNRYLLFFTLAWEMFFHGSMLVIFHSSFQFLPELPFFVFLVIVQFLCIYLCVLSLLWFFSLFGCRWSLLVHLLLYILLSLFFHQFPNLIIQACFLSTIFVIFFFFTFFVAYFTYFIFNSWAGSHIK